MCYNLPDQFMRVQSNEMLKLRDQVARQERELAAQASLAKIPHATLELLQRRIMVSQEHEQDLEVENHILKVCFLSVHR
jgi:hypothetical protein